MKKIVIATIEAGGGHNSPAIAVEESLSGVYGADVQVDILDFCKEVGAAKIDRMHKDGWAWALSRPRYVRFIYGVFDFFGPFTRAAISIVFLGFFKKAKNWLEVNQPDIFFSTHFLTGAAAIYGRKRLNTGSFPIIMYVTEPNDISALWLWRGVDKLLVSSRSAAEKAVRKGMTPEQVMEVGYPVRPSFFKNRRDKDTIRKELNIVPEKLTLLVSAGAQGIGTMTEYIHMLIERDFPINCVVVCGRNEVLYEELSTKDLKMKKHIRLIPFGFVTNMNELISVSDLVLIKAGPASTYEALFCGVPVIFFHFVENERANIDFVLDRGIGWYTPAPEDLTALLEHILSSGMAELEKRKKRIRELELKNGSREIAQFLVEQHLN